MSIIKTWIKYFPLIILGLGIVACGPEGYEYDEYPAEPPQEEIENTGELPGIVEVAPGFVLSSQISIDQNMQIFQTFTENHPALLEDLNMAAVEQDQSEGFGTGDLAVNWDSRQMVYKQDANQNLLVDVLAAPIQSSSLEPEKYNMLAAAGALPESVTVGAIAVLSDYPDLTSGEYLLVWHPDENEMNICDPETGVCKPPEFCEDSNPVFEPIIEISEGSVTICVRFDSRSCCVTFGKQ